MAPEQSKLLHIIEGNQCSDLTVDFSVNATLDQVHLWWKSYSYKYTTWEAGLCPPPFTVLGHVDHPIEGVATQELAEAPTSEVGDAMNGTTVGAAVLDCSFGDAATLSMDISRAVGTKGNIKIRTCRNDIGCIGSPGSWNSFKDCPAKLGPGGTASLKFEKKVVYFVFLNTGSSGTDEFWQSKNGSWPQSHVISV